MNKINAVTNEELQQEQFQRNLSDSILNKLTTLKISTTKLANDTGINYHTIRNIIEKISIPNTRILLKIAHYFNITLDELVSINTNPQSIPVIQKKDVIAFISNTLDVKDYPKIKFSEYIHPHAFAIKEQLSGFIISSEIEYICFRGSKQTLLEIEQVYLVKINNELEFIRVIENKDNKIKYLSQIEVFTAPLPEIEYIATVINMKMAESLL